MKKERKKPCCFIDNPKLLNQNFILASNCCLPCNPSASQALEGKLDPIFDVLGILVGIHINPRCCYFLFFPRL